MFNFSPPFLIKAFFSSNMQRMLQILLFLFILVFSLKVGSGLLCEKVEQYPVLYNDQRKGYREKDVVSNVWNAGAKDLEFIKKTKGKLILFFMLYMG